MKEVNTSFSRNLGKLPTMTDPPTTDRNEGPPPPQDPPASTHDPEAIPGPTQAEPASTLTRSKSYLQTVTTSSKVAVKGYFKQPPTDADKVTHPRN